MKENKVQLAIILQESKYCPRSIFEDKRTTFIKAITKGVKNTDYRVK